MTTGIRQSYSVGGKRYKMRVVGIELDAEHEFFRQNPVTRNILKELGRETHFDSPRYIVQMLIHRKSMAMKIPATDEMDALAKALKTYRKAWTKFLRLDRYDRRK